MSVKIVIAAWGGEVFGNTVGVPGMAMCATWGVTDSHADTRLQGGSLVGTFSL